jgi:hypothetical protein
MCDVTKRAQKQLDKRKILLQMKLLEKIKKITIPQKPRRSYKITQSGNAK